MRLRNMLLVSGFLILAGAWYGLSVEEAYQQDSIELSVKTPSGRIHASSDSPQAPQDLTDSPELKKVAEQVAGPSSPPLLMQPASMEAVHDQFGAFENLRLLDGRHFIHVNSEVIKTFGQGSRFQIYLDDEEELYDCTVKVVTEFEGIRRFSGHFNQQEEGKFDRFSITLSEDGSYVAGDFSTSEGSFTLEAKNDMGWINNVSNEEEYLHNSEEEQGMFMQDPEEQGISMLDLDEENIFIQDQDSPDNLI